MMYIDRYIIEYQIMSGKRVMATLALGVGGYMYFQEQLGLREQKKEYLSLLQKVETQDKAYYLTPEEHINYPWIYKNQTQFKYHKEDEWECKRVRLRGYF